MTRATIAAYGEWASPITADLLASSSVRFGGIACDGADLYWIEGRPAEAGRNVLVRRRPDGGNEDVTPAPYNVRTQVHEYGGGAFAVDRGQLWFSHFNDGRVYRLRAGVQPEPLTPEGPYRYADFAVDALRARLVCVRESRADAGREPVNELVAVGLADGKLSVLATGHDFYASPRLDPAGKRLAWLSWDHPNMPWDGTELWVAELGADGRPGTPMRIAGGRRESVYQPEWDADGGLYFVTDPEGWWNLHRWDGAAVRCVCKRTAEFGRPQWQLGQATYGIAERGKLVCAYVEQGSWRLAVLDPATGRLAPLAPDLTDISDIAVAPGHAVVIGGGAALASAVVRVEIDTGATEVLRESAPWRFGAEYLSTPEPIRFPTGEGTHAHAFWYAPRNPAFRAPEATLPPLIVIGHGGPTGATTASLALAIQYWTSRGIGVLDVNYRGSTGYGRAYRELLYGKWGVADVEDCVRGAGFLAELGRVDRSRLAIRGGSAGGYTTLCALTFHDQFKAGASYYGISDLETLAQDTHKFESRYLDQLIGPYPAQRDLYAERSPIHFVERLACPLIFFQGLDDKVVPPNQAQAMVDALRRKRLPVAYLPFAGEQHGFRQAATIKRALEAELYFYGKIFGFTPADPIEPVEIENL